MYVHPTIFVLWPRPSPAVEHINIRIAAFGFCKSLKAKLCSSHSSTTTGPPSGRIE